MDRPPEEGKSGDHVGRAPKPDGKQVHMDFVKKTLEGDYQSVAAKTRSVISYLETTLFVAEIIKNSAIEKIPVCNGKPIDLQAAMDSLDYYKDAALFSNYVEVMCDQTEKYLDKMRSEISEKFAGTTIHDVIKDGLPEPLTFIYEKSKLPNKKIEEESKVEPLPKPETQKKVPLLPTKTIPDEVDETSTLINSSRATSAVTVILRKPKRTSFEELMSGYSELSISRANPIVKHDKTTKPIPDKIKEEEVVKEVVVAEKIKTSSTKSSGVDSGQYSPNSKVSPTATDDIIVSCFPIYKTVVEWHNWFIANHPQPVFEVAVPVEVGYYENPENFYLNHNPTELNQMGRLIQMKCDAMKTKGITMDPEMVDRGVILFAKFEDNLYYRAKVIKMLPGRNFDVYYFDYGNTQVVHLDDLLPMDRSILRFPVQALWCKLRDYHRKKHKASTHIGSFAARMKNSWDLKAKIFEAQDMTLNDLKTLIHYPIDIFGGINEEDLFKKYFTIGNVF